VGNMNGQTRKKKYALLAREDGEYCRCCGLLPSEGQLVVDHRDNNNYNNSRENLQLLCRRCNYMKNPRGPLAPCESESENESDCDVERTEISINRTAEPMFKKSVYQMINENDHKPIPEKELINSGSELVGISPVTAKRYIDKMCSHAGVLQRKKVGHTIVILYKQERKLA